MTSAPSSWRPTAHCAHWLDEADGWRLAYRDAQATVHVRADRTDCLVSPPAAP